MKKILISLGIIGAAAALVIGGTTAFFSDTQTSAGNVFIAGSVDLKVDHKFASYNGNQCVMNCVENTSNLIANGDFEMPIVTDPANWDIFPTGYAGLAWTVEWEGSQITYDGHQRPAPALVEYQKNLYGWLPQSGDQWAELDSDWFGPNDTLNGEPALVNIYQNIPTEVGKQYVLYYYFSPRPGTTGGDNTLKVRIDGVEVQSQGPVAGTSQTNWTGYSYTFFAVNATTKVEFAGAGSDNSLGVFLDNVRMYSIDCDYNLVGGTCKLWEEKDMAQGDFFYSFDDVKPGDSGINIISLHVDNNNAYTCLYTKDIVESENGINDPEFKTGDTNGLGELLSFLKVFAWQDDGNNVYDVGEPILVPADTLFSNEMISLLLDGGGATKYIGIAWCAGNQSVNGSTISCDGSQMGNVAQTDSVIASLEVYAVQQRNNPNFTCSQLVR
jgi:predicted ribosomally synthesized peptide with SipW-like signal peptide